MEQEEPPLLDEGLGWMDIWIRGEAEIVEEPRAPVVLMPDEPEF
jgi:disease resistance protein RPS2